MIRFLRKYQLTEFALLVAASLGSWLLMKPLFIWSCIHAKIKGELNEYLRLKSYITDVEANVTGKYFWNTVMKKNPNIGPNFGDPIESLSYAMGKQNEISNQSGLSKGIEKYLLEPAEENHCANAVKILDKTIANRLINLN